MTTEERAAIPDDLPEDQPLTPQDLAQVIAQRRNKAGLTQEGLAAYALDSNVTQQTVSRWERGEGLAEHVAFLNVLEALDLILTHRRYSLTSKDPTPTS